VALTAIIVEPQHDVPPLTVRDIGGASNIFNKVCDIPDGVNGGPQ